MSDDALTPIPVSLLSPVFGQFSADLKDSHHHNNHNISSSSLLSLSSQDFVFVLEVTETLSRAFLDENGRLHAFRRLFEDYIGQDLMLAADDDNGSRTDASLYYRSSSSNSSGGVMCCHLEVRGEGRSHIGDEDLTMKAVAIYIKSLPAKEKQLQPRQQFPCFLLELSGTTFSVSGVLSTDAQIVCNPLSPSYRLLNDPEPLMAMSMARLFAALKKSIQSLTSSDLSLPPPSSFPFLTTFRCLSSGEEYSFQYKQRLSGRLVFSGEILPSGPEIVIKFCQSYSSEVHSYCHSKGFAPALKAVHRVGDYVFVVMEKLELRTLSNKDLAEEGVQDQLTLILEALKAKKYVHGDMRGNNIQFDSAANRVVLIDFDWAGVEDEAVYPAFMNPNLGWPEGAAYGRPLRHEHDVWWVKASFRATQYAIW